MEKVNKKYTIRPIEYNVKYNIKNRYWENEIIEPANIEPNVESVEIIFSFANDLYEDFVISWEYFDNNRNNDYNDGEVFISQIGCNNDDKFVLGKAEYYFNPGPSGTVFSFHVTNDFAPTPEKIFNRLIENLVKRNLLVMLGDTNNVDFIPLSIEQRFIIMQEHLENLIYDELEIFVSMVHARRDTN